MKPSDIISQKIENRGVATIQFYIMCIMRKSIILIIGNYSRIFQQANYDKFNRKNLGLNSTKKISQYNL